jgi:hypothetical protein
MTDNITILIEVINKLPQYVSLLKGDNTAQESLAQNVQPSCIFHRETGLVKSDMKKPKSCADRLSGRKPLEFMPMLFDHVTAQQSAS